MKMKRDKYVSKALSELNLIYNNSEHESELNTEKDIDKIIAERKSLLTDAENNLIEIQEAIIQVKSEIETLELLKHQVKVEQYKELNPKHKVF